MNACSGLSASFLMHCEMYGKPGMNLKLIVNEHFITQEILASFSCITKNILGNDYDFSNICKEKNYKAVLKELNTKSNGIMAWNKI